MACQIPHSYLKRSKKDFLQAASFIPIGNVRAAVDQCPTRLRASVKEKANHFESNFVTELMAEQKNIVFAREA